MVTRLHIRGTRPKSACGRLSLGAVTYPCLLGRSGRRYRKREGDGATPVGTWELKSGFYRPDRLMRPFSGPRLRMLRQDDGWCDASSSCHYNRHVRLPFLESHEVMWRTDRAYDIVFPTSHNERPRIIGRGSAIFLHVAHSGASCTAGCVAVAAEVMRKLLQRCGRRTVLVVWP